MRRGRARTGFGALVAGGMLAAVVFAHPLGASPSAAENRYGVAVIIGNKTYKGRTPAVDFAHNDADAMKRFVIERLGYRPGNIIDLRDASKGEIETVFGSEKNHKGRLFNWVRAGKSDVIVFYSGHGVPGLKDRRAICCRWTPIPTSRRSAGIRWTSFTPISRSFRPAR